MTKVLERQVVEVERVLRPEPTRRPRFPRWMAWLLGAMITVGAAGLIWYGVDAITSAEPVTSVFQGYQEDFTGVDAVVLTPGVWSSEARFADDFTGVDAVVLTPGVWSSEARFAEDLAGVDAILFAPGPWSIDADRFQEDFTTLD